MTPPVLAYAVLASRAPEAAGDVLHGLLGLPRRATADPTVTLLGVGAAALAVVPLGHPLAEGTELPGVHHIALACADPRQAARAAGMAAGAERVGLDGASVLPLDPAQTAGVRTVLTGGPRPEPAAVPLIERLDHLGIAAADTAAGIAAFCGSFGMALESQQTDMEVMVPLESFTSDKYGVVHHARAPVATGGLRVAFVTVGDCELEFLANFDPRQAGEVAHGSAGTTRQDQGAIARFVASRGPGLHHLAFKTPEIDAVLARLDRAGVRMIDRAGRPGSRRARIGFVHPAALGGVLIHFVERTPA